MPFLRPDSDLSLGGWSDPSFSVIDEVTPDDNDFTQSPARPVSATLLVSLSDVPDPQTNTDHVVRYRIEKDQVGGAQVNLVVRLMELAVEIASWTETNIANGFVTIARTLTPAQADSIVNYSDLRLEWSATQV